MILHEAGFGKITPTENGKGSVYKTNVVEFQV